MRIILILFCIFGALVVFAAEPPAPQASTEVLIERRMRIEAQIQSFAYALRDINLELEKRKAAGDKLAEKALENK